MILIAQKIGLVVSLFGIVVCVFYMVKVEKHRGYMIAPLSWLLNVFAFHIQRVYLRSLLDPVTVNMWSYELHFQALFTIVFGLVVMTASHARVEFLCKLLKLPIENTTRNIINTIESIIERECKNTIQP